MNLPPGPAKILDAAAMRAADEAAILDHGISGVTLMENAARAVVEALTERYPGAGEVLVVCGPGNNGGDGLAAARMLAERGRSAHAVLASGGRPLRGDAAVELDRLRAAGLPLRELAADEQVDRVLDGIRPSVVVDALFGTGLSRALTGQFAALTDLINALDCPCVAVDIPSGLDGSRNGIPGPHVRAELTVALGAPKIAHVLSPAADVVGELVVADIGLPASVLDAAPAALLVQGGADIGALVRRRPALSHKGDYGHVLLVAGSSGMAGAAILAARAALRAGAGLLTAAVPASIQQTVTLGVPEAMTLALPVSEGGGLEVGAVGLILEAASSRDVVALGPGLGGQGGTADVVREVVMRCTTPLVLDADGLNAFAGRIDTLAGRVGATVLTPHPGELARLQGAATADIEADRPRAAAAAAAASGAVVVLKGHQSLIAEGGSPIWVNDSGNPGMATAGCGDVLTGLIAALLGQGHDALTAVRMGVYLHGAAGDMAAAGIGERSIVAGDVLAALPAAMRALEAA